MTTSALPKVAGADDLRHVMGIDFSAQQIDAITAPLAPGVIVAGAGSGKTTVMSARVVWLVATGRVRADQVLGLTFTNKAAAELAQRVREYLRLAGLLPTRASSDEVEHEVLEPTVLTYHSYAARLLAEHGLRIGHEPDTRLIADASRYQLASRAVRSHRGAVDHLTTWVATNVTGLLNLDAQLSEHLVSPDELLTFQAREAPLWREARQTQAVATAGQTFEKRRELLRFVEDYRRLKSELGVFDFSDQLARAAQLAVSAPEVGASERDRFRVVLLDEYQDTSVAQATLLTALFSDSVDASGRGHPVTAVGDPCQAIYGWRGASASNIDSFAASFPSLSASGDVVRYPLSVNRRSQARILAVANGIATELYLRHRGTEPLVARPTAAEGIVRAAVFETYQDELDFLATQVPKAHADMADPDWSQIAVLVRDNTMASAVHDALTVAGVPVEVVGLSGLLGTPEVAEVVATLDVLHDVTANASLLSLLTGPRWAIGVRDLALLGRRARALAGGDESEANGIQEELGRAVAGTDPADVVSLLEALEDPGGAAYSTDARLRFAQLAAELRALRRHVGEPLLDLVRRVIEVTAIDVELASSSSAVAAARRENLASFLDAVASFAGIDNDASLPGLLAYFEAEEEYGRGLSLALPSATDSVKLLTVHRAKGLEWDVVFLPGVCTNVFPTSRGRGRWPTAMQELPTPLRGDAVDLPAVGERSNQGLKAFGEECRAHDELEERRLAYVAVTRPRHQLVVSCHWWGPEQKRPRGPSVFMRSVIDTMALWGEDPEVEVLEPAAGAVNPVNRALDRYEWPVEASADEVHARLDAAALVRTAQAQGWQQAASRADAELGPDEQALVQQWDRELDRLLLEAQSQQPDEVVVPLPAAMSATTLLQLNDDPERLAESLARPMPRRPSSSARFGTRFHAWVEAHFGQQQLIDPDELPGRADSDITGDVELRELIDAFSSGPYGSRVPHRVEAPFALVLAGRLVRGRIDAVYETPGGFQVVDWKTGQAANADALQLAIYRLAWAELAGIPVDRVEAAFYFVRTAEVVTYGSGDLPGRTELERLISGS
ncbi:MAG TPA: ATP-dependent DNA helicase [Nocardioidaceae bacterium]|nr:ATP-dependent DNA helicase [Nocardioidaceae bacterium]